MNNPFSKDYKAQVVIDHQDRKYKRPVLNQPPKNSRVMLSHPPRGTTQGDISGRIRRSEI